MDVVDVVDVVDVGVVYIYYRNGNHDQVHNSNSKSSSENTRNNGICGGYGAIVPSGYSPIFLIDMPAT